MSGRHGEQSTVNYPYPASDPYGPERRTKSLFLSSSANRILAIAAPSAAALAIASDFANARSTYRGYVKG